MLSKVNMNPNVNFVSGHNSTADTATTAGPLSGENSLLCGCTF